MLIKVLLVKENGRFETFNSKGWHSYRKCNTFFQDKTIKSKFFELLDHKCPLCKDRPPDRFLQDLTRHMRRDHERFFCDLCVEHLKVCITCITIFYLYCTQNFYKKFTVSSRSIGIIFPSLK